MIGLKMEKMVQSEEVSMKFIDSAKSIFTSLINNSNNNINIDARRKYFELFYNVGLPTFKHEEWKYTNLTFMNDIPFQFMPYTPESDSLDYSKFLNFLNGSLQNVFLIKNGTFINKEIRNVNSILSNSVSDGLIFNDNSYLDKFASFYDATNPFGYLNLAIHTDGAIIHIDENTLLEQPLVFLYYYDFDNPATSNTLSTIEIGENSNVKIIIFFINQSVDKTFANEFLNVHLKQNSNLEINVIQKELRGITLLENINILAERDSHLKLNTFSIGTEFVRNNLNLLFNGPGSSAFLNGIYIVSRDEFVDDHTLVLHNHPNCNSDENFRGILDENGRAVFNGKIFVAKGAQKTNAYQSNKNLLLSNEARINTKPQLEIYADDVKCTHGATAGFLDKEMLFYIISRGISKEKAKSLLLNSFVSDNLEKVEIPELRNYLKEIVARKLNLEDIFFCSSLEEATKVTE
jgi:Fe-S cluster assembly protein SufD